MMGLLSLGTPDEEAGDHNPVLAITGGLHSHTSPCLVGLLRKCQPVAHGIVHRPGPEQAQFCFCRSGCLMTCRHRQVYGGLRQLADHQTILHSLNSCAGRSASASTFTRCAQG